MNPLSRANRLDLIRRWQNRRETTLMVLASHRDASVAMNEGVRFVYEHFRELPQRPLDRLDLLVVGGGVPPDVAARIVALLREYARELCIVVTGTIGPGETLSAVAADTLLLHPMATLTTVVEPGVESTRNAGLESLVSRFVGDGVRKDTYQDLLRGGDAAQIGDALHRLDRAAQRIAEMAALRISPPSSESVDALVQALTVRTARVGEPIARRAARELEGLSVCYPTPDLEQIAFDLHVAYEDALHLLSPRAEGTARAIIESASMLHTLARDAGAPNDEMRWCRHHDTAVH